MKFRERTETVKREGWRHGQVNDDTYCDTDIDKVKHLDRAIASKFNRTHKNTFPSRSFCTKVVYHAVNGATWKRNAPHQSFAANAKELMLNCYSLWYDQSTVSFGTTRTGRQMLVIICKQNSSKVMTTWSWIRERIRLLTSAWRHSFVSYDVEQSYWEYREVTTNIDWSYTEDKSVRRWRRRAAQEWSDIETKTCGRILKQNNIPG